MATKFEQVLDTVHNASISLARMTEPKKKKLDRETLTTIFNVTTIIVGAVAALLPGVKPLAIAAGILTALGKTADTVMQQREAKAEAGTEITVAETETSAGDPT